MPISLFDVNTKAQKFLPYFFRRASPGRRVLSARGKVLR